MSIKKITIDTTKLKYYARGKDNRMIIKNTYLDPYLDLFNGETLSYRLSKKPNTKVILEGLSKVIEKVKHARFVQQFILIKGGHIK